MVHARSSPASTLVGALSTGRRGGKAAQFVFTNPTKAFTNPTKAFTNPTKAFTNPTKAFTNPTKAFTNPTKASRALLERRSRLELSRRW